MVMSADAERGVRGVVRIEVVRDGRLFVPSLARASADGHGDVPAIRRERGGIVALVRPSRGKRRAERVPGVSVRARRAPRPRESLDTRARSVGRARAVPRAIRTRVARRGARLADVPSVADASTERGVPRAVRPAVRRWIGRFGRLATLAAESGRALALAGDAVARAAVDASATVAPRSLEFSLARALHRARDVVVHARALRGRTRSRRARHGDAYSVRSRGRVPGIALARRVRAARPATAADFREGRIRRREHRRRPCAGAERVAIRPRPSLAARARHPIIIQTTRARLHRRAVRESKGARDAAPARAGRVSQVARLARVSEFAVAPPARRVARASVLARSRRARASHVTRRASPSEMARASTRVVIARAPSSAKRRHGFESRLGPHAHLVHRPRTRRVRGAPPRVRRERRRGTLVAAELCAGVVRPVARSADVAPSAPRPSGARRARPRRLALVEALADLIRRRRARRLGRRR